MPAPPETQTQHTGSAPDQPGRCVAWRSQARAHRYGARPAFACRGAGEQGCACTAAEQTSEHWAEDHRGDAGRARMSMSSTCVGEIPQQLHRVQGWRELGDAPQRALRDDGLVEVADDGHRQRPA